MSHSPNTTARPRLAKSAGPGFAPLQIAEPAIGRLADVFKLLADKSRLKIVLGLAKEPELHVSALCDLLGEQSKPASQPAVSHHLTLLRMAGLVGFRRDGKHNYYYLASDYLRDLFEQFFADSGNGHKLLQFPDFALAFKRR